jgi:hypothetical protein
VTLEPVSSPATQPQPGTSHLLRQRDRDTEAQRHRPREGNEKTDRQRQSEIETSRGTNRERAMHVQEVCQFHLDEMKLQRNA